MAVEPGSRTSTGRFAPGKSGNPSGRRKKTQAEIDALEAIRAACPEAVEIALKMLRANDTPAAIRLRIVEMIINRTYGREPIAADADQSDGVIRLVVEGYAGGDISG